VKRSLKSTITNYLNELFTYLCPSYPPGYRFLNGEDSCPAELGAKKDCKGFSESDRRALALSIFWAKIELLDEQQKQNAILVLDDPVTSFDDGRIDRTIRLMEENRPAFRQIIVLSHYPRYLKSFFERASLNTSGIQLSKIIVVLVTVCYSNPQIQL